MSTKRISRWTIFWVTAIVTAVIADIIAATNKQKGDTLTEHIRAFIGWGRPLSGWARLRRLAFLAFWAWATMHLLFAWA